MKALLMRFAAAFAFAGFVAFAPARAQSAAPPVEQFKLDNGFTVIVKPDHRAPTAVQMVWVRVGSMDEVDGWTGPAPMLEPMLVKGTKQLKVGEFRERIAQLGGRENAFTNRDNTAYYQQIPANRLEEVMK